VITISTYGYIRVSTRCLIVVTVILQVPVKGELDACGVVLAKIALAVAFP